MKILVKLNYAKHLIRAVIEAHHIYFVGTDIGYALGFKKPRNAIERRGLNIHKIDVFKERRLMLNLDDTAQFVMTSRKPGRFILISWITKVAIPELKKADLRAGIKSLVADNRALKAKLSTFERQAYHFNLNLSMRQLALVLRQHGIMYLPGIDKKMGRNNLISFLQYQNLLTRKDEPLETALESGMLKGVPTQFNKNGNQCVRIVALATPMLQKALLKELS